MNKDQNIILDVQNVSKFFGSLCALNQVSFQVSKGECLAVVGESGSGKSTLGNLILGTESISSGQIMFEGELLTQKRSLAIRKRIQVVQQNPMSALNPKRNVFQNITLPLQVHTSLSHKEQKQEVQRLLDLVKLPQDFMWRFPDTLSGGQRQRVAVARSIASRPDLIVLDEPTSALDVLVQVNVLKLLQDIRKEYDLTYLFITHDLGVVRNIADRMAIFQKGNLIESASVETMFSEGPQQTYAKNLLGAIPVVSDEEVLLKQNLLKN